jgi:hypothetical protein
MNQSAAPASESAPRVVPVQPISVPARARHEEPGPQAEGRVEEDAARAPAANAPAAAAGRPTADEIKQTARKRSSAKTAPAPAAQAPEAPKPAPAQAAPPPPDAFPGAARSREQAEDNEKSGASGIAPAESGGVFEKRTAPAAAQGLASPTPPSGSIELRRDMQLAPQDWLSHIHQLMRQGRRQQAIESLRLFQRAHPDWEIPDDLRPLLH